MSDPNQQLKRFAIYGAVFGLSFPILGTLIQAAASPQGLSIEGLIAAQSMPVLWIIDTAPIVLAWFASMAGRRQDQLQAVLRELRHSNRELNTKNEALGSANEELVRAGQLKSQFLANMSHELRTPLNAIIGFSRILMKKTEGLLPARQARNIAMVNESGQHLLALVNDILDIERIQAGMLTIRASHTNISELATDVVAKLTPAADAKALQLALDVEGKLHMDTDPVRLRQVLDNLVNNAIKYSDEGTITLALSTTADEVVFSVHDEGIGISEDMLETVFAPFSQVDGSTTRAQGGVGLGLHLVSELVGLLGGRVDAESEEGKGSTFRVTLPRDAPEALSKPQSGVGASIDLAADGTGPSVLLIDDTPSMLEVTRSELVDAGFRVHVALDGKTGVAMAKEVRPSAILLDIVMPGMDGWAVLRELRADPALKRVPVIITSQLDQEDTAAELGVAGWLTKPTSVEAFREIMDKVGVGTGHVLVVEDDEATAALVRQHLEELELHTHHASDGAEAMQQLRQALPNAVVLDLMLPKLNGFDVLDGLRRLPGGAHIPVIIYTAKDLSEEERARLSVGPVAIVGKGDAGGINSLSEYMRLVELT